MNRKHYRAIAAHLSIVLEQIESETYTCQRDVFDDIVWSLIAVCKLDNTRFDPEKFRDAIYKETDES